eukprot:GHVS01022469.1.p1 GENE.GHVS01022469.1~~GHVS01022469.1.p1  ORF type:complete len:188 (-),score=17.39 GHVS01022469.1:174-737(-)
MRNDGSTFLLLLLHLLLLLFTTYTAGSILSRLSAPVKSVHRHVRLSQQPFPPSSIDYSNGPHRLLAFGYPFAKFRRQTKMLSAICKQLEPREPSNLHCGESKSDYAVISIPLEFAVHRSAYEVIANLPQFLLRLERLLLRTASVIATSIGLAIAVPRLVHQFGGLTLATLPPLVILLLPCAVAVFML